ncbi:hypothetical protein SAMN04487917_103148 [Arthrobacter sp. yr096]|uniref:hypothetical protein n=1 Tax=Arthrobacter sp. yr096 TaxID=1761750 RepID=UPI0008D81C5D|nr:hypothetical protein [Arthrobacter sp. yr096]SEI96407.1 hypothetical protein SAMN04487917_103148 [Arthrobacter sp. yr096]
MTTAQEQEDFFRPWPLGPHYGELADGAGPRAWVNYKLHSADWYIETLEAAIAKVGFDRHVGIEMALDGALTSLCAGYDASSAALIGVAERYLQVEEPTPLWEYKPSLLIQLLGRLSQQGLTGDLIGTRSRIKAALVRKETSKGWLTMLQDLRNRPMHNDTLPRHFDAVVGSPTASALNVGGTPTEPVSYLREAYRDVSNLSGELLDIVDKLAPNGMITQREP